MKNNYIPEILKEKLLSAYRLIYAMLFLVSISLAIALLSFDINDNSLLTTQVMSQQTY